VNPIDLLLEPLAYDFFVRALVASALVGVACAVVGSFVVLKGMSFIGDAVSHAAFPGIVVAYMLGLPIILGGAVAAIGTALGIGALTRRSGLRADSIIGVLFAGMFALGVALFSSIPNYVGDLFAFLFGDVLGISVSDMVALIVLVVALLLVIRALWKELLFATPAATAQLLVKRFGQMIGVAALIGVTAAVAGLYLSYALDLASGAAIVLFETALFLVVLLATSLRGRRTA